MNKFDSNIRKLKCMLTKGLTGNLQIKQENSPQSLSILNAYTKNTTELFSLGLKITNTLICFKISKLSHYPPLFDLQPQEKSSSLQTHSWPKQNTTKTEYFQDNSKTL